MSASPPISAESLESKIAERLPGTTLVRAEDQSGGCGQKFDILVVSASFEGKGMLVQHRAVHKAIEEEMRVIHAVTLKTVTPAAWSTDASNPAKLP